MVSRLPADRKFMNLPIEESAAAWIMFFVAKCCVDKKKDMINTNGNQTASRQNFSGSIECRISYCVDYVFCG